LGRGQCAQKWKPGGAGVKKERKGVNALKSARDGGERLRI